MGVPASGGGRGVKVQGSVGVSVSQLYWYSYQFLRRVRHRHLLSHELSATLDVSKGCEALCPEEVEEYGFL